jgi:hypothetical protein
MRNALTLVTLLMMPAAAFAQTPSTPVAVNLQKVPVGSWADYTLSLNDVKGKVRWAVVERNSEGVSLETITEGGPAALMGQPKVSTKMVLAPDFLGSDKPIKRVIMQPGDRDPVEVPPDHPQLKAQKFTKPDPKKLVGKETLKVPAGSFQTSHYRDQTEVGTVDFWMTDSVPPLGLVKLTVTPKEGSPTNKVALELTGKGTDAKATITKKPVPMNQAMGAGSGPGAGPPKPAKGGAKIQTEPQPAKPEKK